MAIIRYVRHVVFVTSVMMCAMLTGSVAAAQTSFTTIDGEIGPGAQYRIYVPTAVPWNGDVVVFLQGIADPAEAVALTGPGAVIRDALMNQGFALIFTSRSVAGYGAVKDGMIRTHQLRGVFASRVGEPAHVYLLGRSLGSLIAVMLAESFPTQYDGVVSGCGLLGGGAEELTYLGDA
jgi:pimeloyl-ACP methyl ester carboxylesterase